MIKAQVDNDGVKIEASGDIVEITAETGGIITALHSSIPDNLRPKFRESIEMLVNAPDSPLWRELLNDQ